MGGDLLRIVESAYAPEQSTQAWLEGILHSAMPFDLGAGTCCYAVRMERDGSSTPLGMASHGAIDFEPMVRPDGLPPDVVRVAHTPAAGLLDSRVDLPKILRRCQSTIPQIEAAIHRSVPSMQIAIAGDHRHVLVLAFCADSRHKRLPERTRRLFPMVIAHLAAAARLRGRQSAAGADAWLSPSGHVLDARGAAKEPAHRRLLTSAVQQSERARGPLRRTSPEEALKIWRGLVKAEWSLVDTVERDGKRFVLARKNRPDVPRQVALTDTERAVAYFAAAGHAQKYIAYELGISASTVAHHLQSALLKLGLRSRIDLARLYGGGSP